MELEFDKEIDAILRKARGGGGVSVTTAHIDADTISAFVENTLPQQAKMLTIEHFADCERCRKQLAFAMSISGDEVSIDAAGVVAPNVETAVPWYSKIFRTPNLALAMGALVLAFSGIIGYLAIQNRSAETRSDVAAANASKPMPSEPAATGIASNSNSEADRPIAANTNINPAAPASGPAAGPTSSTSQPGATAPTGVIDQPTVAAKSADTDTSGGASASESPEAKSVATQPIPRAKDDQPLETRDEKPEPAKTDVDDLKLADRSKIAEDRISREGPYSPKKKESGPTRAGPSITQQQSNANIYAQTPLRSVGGKNFDNRGGVWYDTSYSGQPMIRVTRGSDAYKDLDGSIKRIAENLGGTVVVVWKAKAYRIQ